MSKVNTPDDLDRDILIALQADGRVPWATIAHMCNVPVATVSRRGRKLLDAGTARVAVVPSRDIYGPVDSLLVWIVCTSGKQLSVAESIMQRDDIRFLSLTTGEADIVAELVTPKSDGGVATAVLDIQALPGVSRVQTDLILHVYKSSLTWGARLSEEMQERLRKPSAQPSRHSRIRLDRTDIAIQTILHADGRAPLRVVASELGLKTTTVRRRFQRMRNSGCVSVATLIEASTLGFEKETMLAIRAEPSNLTGIAARLAGHRDVRYLTTTLVGNALICEVIATSTEDLYHFVSTVLGEMNGVLGWTAFMESVTLKRSGVETPWWRDRTADHVLRQGQTQPRAG